MKVHILDDYDSDCEVYPEGSTSTWVKGHPLYEVPDDLVSKYEAVNKLRDCLKQDILLIKRQGPV